MKPAFSFDSQDVGAIAIVFICSPIFAIMQHYQDAYLFGSVIRAILASFLLGVCFTFPLFIYLLAKYLRRAYVLSRIS